jgi:hypothetical protein
MDGVTYKRRIASQLLASLKYFMRLSSAALGEVPIPLALTLSKGLRAVLARVSAVDVFPRPVAPRLILARHKVKSVHF